MKKNRLIFFLIFGVYHLVAFIFTIALDNNSNLLFRMVKWVPTFKWITLLGLIMLIVDIIWTINAKKELKKENAALQHEVNTLKAKLFDMQEASKGLGSGSQSPSTTTPK